jgi:L-aminopeptidase/D-esterase-like protein
VQLNALFAAASEAFATACIDAVVTASMVGDTPSYRDLCPSAWPG